MGYIFAVLFGILLGVSIYYVAHGYGLFRFDALKPTSDLSHFIKTNNHLFNYWKVKGNEEYANAHQMLINAYTIVPEENDKP